MDIMLKVSRKGVKGYQISSVPLRKLKAGSVLSVRSWSLVGDFLVLHATV
jgi:hypothetical protein